MRPSDVIDPIRFLALGWPDVRIYDKQRDVLYSLVDDDETIVPAGNMLGKDFIAGYAVLWFFLSRNPCRIVTTSAKDDHLRVLWGEINRFIDTCRIPLKVEDGGILRVLHHEIRKVIDGKPDAMSYLKGMVASPDSIASMQGHHVPNEGDGVPRTLFVADESSSVPDAYHQMARTWAQRILSIGNPWSCENFFRRGVREGDLFSANGRRCYRRVIRIRAEDSPNVKHEIERMRAGIREPNPLLIRTESQYWGVFSPEEFAELKRRWTESEREDPGDSMLLPGVKPFAEYVKNRETWDEYQQKVSLDGEFHEGADVKLYPEAWLDRAAKLAESLSGKGREAVAIGIDPAEGGDETTIVVVDGLGVLDVIARRTPDTSVIVDAIIEAIEKWKVPPSMVAIDRGGGGKEHADRLRRLGYPIVTVGFGESATTERRVVGQAQRVNERERNYAYANRRAQMYGLLRLRLDPSNEQFPHGFAIPAKFTELVRQLKPIPLDYDGEGSLVLLPKSRSYAETVDGSPNTSKKRTMFDLLGRSPDHADALVLAVYAMDALKRPVQRVF